MSEAYQASQQTDKTHEWQTVKKLFAYIWPKHQFVLRIRVVLAFICLLLAKGFIVYMPLVYKEAIDALSLSGQPILAPIGLIISYGLLRFSNTLFSELRDFLFINVGQEAIRHAALNTFRRLHQLSLAFHLNRETGGLSRVIERGIRGIDFVLAFMTFNIVPTLFEIFLVCGILCYKFNYVYALITFTTIFIYIGFTLVITEWRIRYRKRMNEMDTIANTKAIDSLLNYETVKYFGNEAYEAQAYDASLKQYKQAAIVNQGSLAMLNLGQGIIIMVGLIAVMWLAANGIVKGKLSIGDFVLVNTYLIQLYLPLHFLGFVYRQMKQSFVDMEKMFELTDIEPQIKDETDARELVVDKGNIQFQSVYFGYVPEREIIQDLSFELLAGQTLAIVGATGSGKSTLARLLFRFYDIQKGEILIDGQNIRHVLSDSLHAAIGVVPQDAVLFNSTIYYNIAYGDPQAPKEAVVRAAQKASIHDFILSLPKGYDTLVGERGLKLSGGEKQRVAIARTFLKNPPILIFDEATSALDTQTEREIQQALREVSVGKTTLVIAHRLSTIVDADQIIVLEAGKIVERGTHQSLLAQDGVYASMWKKQSHTPQK